MINSKGVTGKGVKSDYIFTVVSHENNHNANILCCILTLCVLHEMICVLMIGLLLAAHTDRRRG